MTDAETTRTPITPPDGTAAGAGSPPIGSVPTSAPPPPASAFPPPASAPPPPAVPSPAASPPPSSAGPSPASPSWRPPASDSGRNASLIFGAIVLLVGLWFFATTTLGLDLPRIDWGQLWPVILIALGAWVVLGAVRQSGR